MEDGAAQLHEEYRNNICAQVHQHFGEPHHSQLFGVRQRPAAGGAHARSGDALELSLRAAGTNRIDKRRAQVVTGQFPGHQCDA